MLIALNANHKWLRHLQHVFIKQYIYTDKSMLRRTSGLVPAVQFVTKAVKAQACGRPGTGFGIPLCFFFSWLERLTFGLLGGTGRLWRLLLA